jgi:hypothetical protein
MQQAAAACCTPSNQQEGSMIFRESVAAEGRGDPAGARCTQGLYMLTPDESKNVCVCISLGERESRLGVECDANKCT